MENIREMLQQIAQQKQIKILYACETGSRAWGFPSPDSDYDVRFIYMHERDWYLHLGEKNDTLELMQGDLDITGWDLGKSLKLLKKSNAALIERFQSPMQYYCEPGFTQAFNALIKVYYSPTAVFYHHYSLMNKFWDDMLDKREVKLKGYFYMIRSLLSCLWIIKEKSVLPMHIEGLMIFIENDIQEQLRRLIALKATVTEKYMYEKDMGLNTLLLNLRAYIETSKYNLGVTSSDYTLLNDFFLKTVNGKANNRLD